MTTANMGTHISKEDAEELIEEGIATPIGVEPDDTDDTDKMN